MWVGTEPLPKRYQKQWKPKVTELLQKHAGEKTYSKKNNKKIGKPHIFYHYKIMERVGTEHRQEKNRFHVPVNHSN
jgi:hypothetical protein